MDANVNHLKPLYQRWYNVCVLSGPL